MTGFLLFAMGLGANAAGGESGDLRKAVTLYASFDDEVRGDVGAGDLGLSTRTGDPKKGPFVFTKGFDKNVFRIAKGKGVHGGALEVINWRNFDTGKADAKAALFIDGKQIGEVKDRAIAVDWDVERAGIYVAVNFIGLLDELAVFNRSLTPDEVARLHREPGVLAGLKQ